MPLTVAAATATVNTSIMSNNVVNAASKLWSSAKKTSLSNKATEIRKMSLNQRILPEPSGKDLLLPFIKTPLMEFLRDAYTKQTRGDSHVVYARSSIGKTMACFAFMRFVAPRIKSQALMITGAQKHVPYITHMAKQLGVENEEDVLVDLVAGMRTVAPTPASVLILDEMNGLGVDQCNITLVDVLMRFVYQNYQGIHVIVLTQNQTVADELCKLNKWQKIAPMNGLTEPSRKAVRDQEEDMPSMTDADDPIPWLPEVLEWSLDNLTKFIDTRFKGHDFEKDEAGIINWLRTGMTPTNAEQKAEELIEMKARGLETLDVYSETL